MSTLSLEIALQLGQFQLAIDQDLELEGITVVFGPSGSGKTTLLRIVAGLESNADGRVSFGGSSWQSGEAFQKTHHRRVGYVFQDGRLFPHFSVRGNLQFAAGFAGRAPAITFDDAVAAFALEALLDRSTRTLSGGERQRVAIARALVGNPSLLLMDEPVSSLDLARKQSVVSYIEQLPERFGLPILYVTHDINEVIRLADQVVLMSRGRIEATGTVREIMDRTDFAELSGLDDPGSVVEARVAGHEERATVLTIGSERLRLPRAEIAEGSAVRLRIHARDVVIATSKPEQISIRNVLSGRVASIRDRSATLCDIGISVDDQQILARITKDAARDLSLSPGQPVFALIKSVAVDAFPLLQAARL